MHPRLDFLVGLKSVPEMRGIEIYDVTDDLDFVGPGSSQVFPGLADGRFELGDRFSVTSNNNRLAGLSDFIDEREAPGLEFCGGYGAGCHVLIVAENRQLYRLKIRRSCADCKEVEAAKAPERRKKAREEEGAGACSATVAGATGRNVAETGGADTGQWGIRGWCAARRNGARRVGGKVRGFLTWYTVVSPKMFRAGIAMEDR